MKHFNLIICVFIIGFNSFSQSTNPLRGLHQYSIPDLGWSFFPTSIPIYKITTVDEIDDHYLLTGGLKYSTLNYAGIIAINKNTHSVMWDYIDTTHFVPEMSVTMAKGLVKRSDILMIGYKEMNENNIDDSLNIVLFNHQSGFIQKNKLAIDTLQRFNRISELNYELSALSGSKLWFNPLFPSNTFQYLDIKPYILLLKNDGSIEDSIVLPLGNVYANLPILWGNADITFPFKNAYLTFGSQLRIYDESPGNITYSNSPTIWHWNQDSIISFKEVYANYVLHSNVIACDDPLSADVKKDNIALITVRNDLCNNGEDENKVFVTFLDTNINVQWCENVGTLSHNEYVYMNDNEKPQVVIDTFTNTLLIYGSVTNLNDVSQSLFFLEKRDFTGNRIYCKHFTVNGDDRQYLHSMTIANNGDLLFAGAGKTSSDTSYFFTYRTDPDGYDPAGHYLGLEVVTASATEIGIFPNPSDGIFQVSSISNEPMKISILDQQGKQVAVFKLNELSSNNSFDLSEQAPGVYFAHISQGEKQWVKKVVLQ